MSTTVPTKWDHEADVIIVGGGAAGIPAAIVAAEAGLKTTLLEAGTACGGSFAIGIGDFAIAGSDEQQAAGIDDSPEIFYQDLVNFSGADPEIARAYTDNQLDAYRMLREVGIRFPGVIQFPGHSRDRAIAWLIGMGPRIIQALEERAKRAGVEILFRHRATRLINDPPTGRVIGLKVSVNDEARNFKASKAVILATGGFGYNREMITEYAPDMSNAVPIMPATHLGDGLRMGMALGAATKDIGAAVTPSLPVCVETHANPIQALFWGSIAVSGGGKRFYEESCSNGFYGSLTGAGMKQPGGVYWIVYDDTIIEQMKRNPEKSQVAYIEDCKQYKENTISELAKSAGIDAQGLTETIDKYNGDIDSVGYDTVLGRRFQFGRERQLLKIATPPFYAIKCATSTTSLKGGLKTNGSAQVVNQYAEVIPSLYAAGEVSGGLHGKSYLSGVMSSAAMTFGIIAARNAAKETAWQQV